MKGVLVMYKNYLKLFFLIALLFLIIFATTAGVYGVNSAENFTIVTSFTILENFAREITGEDGDVRVLSQIGAEVHEWELTPGNFVDLEEADLVFYNGLNVEQWMDQVRAVTGPDVPVIAVGEICDYPALPIVTGDYAGEVDPHIWMDVRGAISYVKVMRDILIEYVPDKAELYQNNAAEYIENLLILHEEISNSLAQIPEEKRVLITTEAAFIYFASAYGFKHDGIWGTNTEEEGTPQQMMRIIKLLEEKMPAGIFWESTGANRYVLSVSDDTGIPVYGPLFVDSVDQKGSKAEDYTGMMRANTELLLKVFVD